MCDSRAAIDPRNNDRTDWRASYATGIAGWSYTERSFHMVSSVTINKRSVRDLDSGYQEHSYLIIIHDEALLSNVETFFEMTDL